MRYYIKQKTISAFYKKVTGWTPFGNTRTHFCSFEPLVSLTEKKDLSHTFSVVSRIVFNYQSI